MRSTDGTCTRNISTHCFDRRNQFFHLGLPAGSNNRFPGSDNVHGGEVDGFMIYETLKLRNNLEVFLMREEIVQERVVWTIVFHLVLCETIKRLKLSDMIASDQGIPAIIRMANHMENKIKIKTTFPVCWWGALNLEFMSNCDSVNPF